jgi:8-oxo-dGTP pyrophosphatase MutT (NUDIX family)
VSADGQKSKSYSGVLLISEDQKLILQRRDSDFRIVNPGRLSAFGGTAFLGESAVNCAIREINEELDYKIAGDALSFLLLKRELVCGLPVECTIFVYKDVSVHDLYLKEGQAIEIVDINSDFRKLGATNLCLSVIQAYEAARLHTLGQP